MQSALTLVAPSAPRIWSDAFARVVGQNVAITLYGRTGSRQYSERGSATLVVTADTAVEMANACRQLVREQDAKSGDFQLEIAIHGKKTRRLPAVRIRNDEAEAVCEDDRESVAERDLARQYMTATREVVSMLQAENAALRKQLHEMYSASIEGMERFADATLNQVNARAAEQTLRATHLERYEGRVSEHAVRADTPDSTVPDAWWNSEPCCDMIKSSVENIASLTGLIAAGLAGAKVP